MKNKFYMMTGLGPVQRTCECSTTVNGIAVNCVRDAKNKKHWTYYSDLTGIELCSGPVGHCTRWINDNAESIRELFKRPRYVEMARDIQLAKEVYDD